MQYTRLVRNLFPLVLLLAIADASASAVIQDLRLEYVDGELQAVITVDGETRPRAFASSELSLVVVDLPDTLLQREFQLPAAPAAGIIQAIRHALGDDGRLRLVFDLQEPARFRVTSVTVDDNFEVHTIYFMPEEGGSTARAERALVARNEPVNVADENFAEKNVSSEPQEELAGEIATQEWSRSVVSYPAVLQLAALAPDPAPTNPRAQEQSGAFVFGQQQRLTTEPTSHKQTKNGGWEAEIERALLETGALTADERPVDSNNHLQLIAGVSRAFDNGFELRLTGRIDGRYQEGAGYGDSSLKADYGESWVRYRADDWRLTAGAQKVVWGRADEISPTDRLSTPDLTRLMLDPRQARRRANPALRFEWFAQEWSLDLVWLPLFREAELPDTESLWHPVDKRRGRIVGLPEDGVLSALVRAGQFNYDAPEDGGGGIRFRRFGQNLDYAFTLQRSRNPMPYFQLDETTREYLLTGDDVPALTGPVIFNSVYPRSWVAGGDFSLAAGAWTFRFEGTWSSDLPVTRENLAYDTVDAWNWVMGAEVFPGDRNFRVTLQLAGNRLGDADDILDRESPLSFNGELEAPFSQNRWRGSLRFNLGLDRSDVYLNPQLIWTDWEPYEFYIGAHFFGGDEVTVGGFYDEQDMVVIGWRGRF